MQNAAPAVSTPQTDADYEKLVDQMLAELKTLNQQMEQDRADIDRLKAHTAQLKAETRDVLTSMGAKF